MAREEGLSCDVASGGRHRVRAAALFGARGSFLGPQRPSEITSYFAIYKNVESLHTGFQNEKLEAIFEQSQRETSRIKRASMYRAIQSIYNDAAPMISDRNCSEPASPCSTLFSPPSS